LDDFEFTRTIGGNWFGEKFSALYAVWNELKNEKEGPVSTLSSFSVILEDGIVDIEEVVNPSSTLASENNVSPSVFVHCATFIYSSVSCIRFSMITSKKLR
jgi:hypothetical protein